MTAPIGPDDNPHPSQKTDSAEQQGYSLDNPGTAEYDPAYIPEREFVLMPLFRRIRDLLGIRRRGEEAEYIYESEPLAPSPQSETEWTDSAVSSIRSEARDLQTEDLPGQELAGEELPAEGLLGIERVTWSEPSVIQETASEPQPQIVGRSEGLAFPEPQLSPPVAPPVASEPGQSAQPLEAASPIREPQPKIVYSQTSPQEIKNLTAPLREAAEKISAVISEAADWLHSKEQEILKRAELPLEPARPLTGEKANVSMRAEAHATIENAPTTLPAEAPALQRELAWREQRTEALSTQQVDSQNVSIQPLASAQTSQRKPQLVPAIVGVPLWKRIDWGQQFTSKRVAVLGGVAMAVLMVLGISIARRPASSVLPQQQTRSIQPGGVTLNTHPAAPAGAPHGRSSNAAAPRSTTPARKPAYRSANHYQEPDVVTHYYTNAKQKPSPAKQATVAGVRHYSDMQ